MNQVCVSRQFDGSQRLHTVASIKQITRKGRLEAWAESMGIKDLDLYNMDGTRVMWILRGRLAGTK